MDRTLFGLSDPGASQAAGQLAGWPDSRSMGGGFGGILNNLGPKWGQLSSTFSDLSAGGDPWQAMGRIAARGGVPSGAEVFQDMLGYAARQGAPSTAAPAAPAAMGAPGTAAPAAPAAPSADTGAVADPSAVAPSPAGAAGQGDLRRTMMAGQPQRFAFGGWGRA
jgi:hypothetical protein